MSRYVLLIWGMLGTYALMSLMYYFYRRERFLRCYDENNIKCGANLFELLHPIEDIVARLILFVAILCMCSWVIRQVTSFTELLKLMVKAPGNLLKCMDDNVAGLL